MTIHEAIWLFILLIPVLTAWALIDTWDRRR